MRLVAAHLAGEPEGDLEMRGRGAFGELRFALEPLGEPVAEARALPLPQQGESRRAAGHQRGQRLVGHLHQAPARLRVIAHGQLAAVAPLPQEALGHAVEQAAPLQRLQAPPLLRLEDRVQADHVLEEITEAALRESGEAAGRDRPVRADRVEAGPDLGREARRRGVRGRIGHEAVVRREAVGPAGLQRLAGSAEERRARGDGFGCLVAAAAHADAVALGRIERVFEREGVEIVLAHQRIEVGRAHGAALERGRGGHEEERREALPSGAGIGPRIGKDQALGGLAQRAVEPAPRLEQAVLRRGERGRRLVLGRGERFGVEERELAAVRAGARNGGGARDGQGLALGVEQERIRPQHPRIAALDETGHRNDAEGQPGHRVERADVDAAAGERTDGQPLPLEAGLEHGFHLAPARARAHRGEAGEIREDLRHCLPVTLAADPRIEDGREPLRPLGPRGLAAEAFECAGQRLYHREERLGLRGPLPAALRAIGRGLARRRRALGLRVRAQPDPPAVQPRHDPGVAADRVPA